MATLHGAIIRALLGPSGTAVLQQRVEQLSESREASVDAAEAERRRIERDLHDGAQQRLVALAMDLGLAKERLERGDDDAATVALVGHAHDEAKRAITELRELVRGIHPAVLADRGLDAALSALAARCPVPVDLQVELPERPPAVIEATAYFVVGEALTNVAKHSKARSVRVRVTRRGPILAVEVTRRRRGRRGRAPLRRAWPAWPTGSGPSRAPCAWPARPAARRRCWRSSRARRDRRGLGPPAGRARPHPGRVRRRGRGHASARPTSSCRP